MIFVKQQNKTTLTVKIHCISYCIHCNPPKHPQFPLEESSMPQNKLEKESCSKEDAVLC